MSTSFVHFKLNYRARTHRFVPNVCDVARLFVTIKVRVAQVVRDKTPAEEAALWKKYSIFWEGDSECFPLETVDDLVLAMRSAKAKPTMPHLVYLIVKQKEAEPKAEPAAPAASAVDAAKAAAVAALLSLSAANAPSAAATLPAVDTAPERKVAFASRSALFGKSSTALRSPPPSPRASAPPSAPTKTGERQVARVQPNNATASRISQLREKMQNGEQSNNKTEERPFLKELKMRFNTRRISTSSLSYSSASDDDEHPTKTRRVLSSMTMNSPESSPDSGFRRRYKPLTTSLSRYEEIEETTPGYEYFESNRYSMIGIGSERYMSKYGSFDSGYEKEKEEEKEKNGWLMLGNSGNDCFLNAAIQYMRRATDLGDALVRREVPEEINEKAEKKERVIEMLLDFLMSKGGRMHPRELRKALPTVCDLERMFLYAQQDAYETLNKIFDDVIPEAIEKQFHIEASTRRRCRDRKDCKGSERKEAGPIYYQHIERCNQIVDLESILSHDWAAEEGETDLLRHCSECCPCCTANEEGHDEDKCEQCKADKVHYVVEKRHTFKGTSNYALVAFNILHPHQRMDWALEENCSMDGMKLMDRYWRAVSVIKHSGRVYNGYSRGHYVAYTRDHEGLWWLHDDDATPSSIGDKYRPTSGMPYAEGLTDMQGVVAILFEKMT